MSSELLFKRFKHELKLAAGLDLDLYKEQQINRRLQSYMQRHSLADYGQLCTYITSKEKIAHLVDYLDINVSEFFRNPELFAYLEEEVFKRILAKHEPMNIWSAGCSNGSEPYSLAIAALDLKLERKAKIWATDLDAGALQQAARGEYAPADIRNVSLERRNKYFEITQSTVKVKAAPRELIQFARHDLLRDPIPRSFELIVCRNVAIYFTEEAKASMLQRFAKSLVKGGILFTGATESYPNHAAYGLNRVHTCFYQKVGE